MVEQDPSIEFLELYALVAAVLTWSNKLVNVRVIIFCNNQAVISMVNNLTSKCQQCMKLIRMLVLDNLKMDRRVFVKFVQSQSNILADALSRLQYKRFWENAPVTMRKYPDAIPSCIFPVENIWFGN